MICLFLPKISGYRFYWSIRDLYKTINFEEFIPDGLVGQLIWREYFYAMCINNPNFGQMEENPICLNIPWYVALLLFFFYYNENY